MPDASKYFAIRKMNVPTGVWTPVPPVPYQCSRIVVENNSSTNDMQFRTDPDDDTTNKPIPIGQELDIAGHDNCFAGGVVVGYVYVAAGNGPVILSFTR